MIPTKSTDATRKRSRELGCHSETLDEQFSTQIKTGSSLTYRLSELSKPTHKESIKPSDSQKRRSIRSSSPLNLHKRSLINLTSRKQNHSSEHTKNSDHHKDNMVLRKPTHQNHITTRPRNDEPTYIRDSSVEVEGLQDLTICSPQNRRFTSTNFVPDEDEMEVEDHISPPPKRQRKEPSPPPLRGVTRWWEKKKKPSEATPTYPEGTPSYTVAEPTYPGGPLTYITKPLPQCVYDRNSPNCPWTCHIPGCITKIWHANTLQGQIEIEDHLASQHYEPERERRRQERRWKGEPEPEEEEM